MESIKKCPVCLNKHDGSCNINTQFDDGIHSVTCEICGRYAITSNAYDDELEPNARNTTYWPAIRRATLSHALLTRREVSIGRTGKPLLTCEVLEKFRKSERTLPIKLQQANNAIQFFGNHERKHGLPLKYPSKNFYAIIGAVNPESACELIIELSDKGILRVNNVSSNDGCAFRDASLTLDGWERWEKERAGENTSSVGMIAMKFGDKELEAFVKNVIKPAVDEIPGLSLEKLGDTPKTGILDVILRQTIRDAAFVIADLSHANNGAYWEAGFAEGLGKPVIYICERSVWDENKTHFDTNHCTTIIYEKGQDDKFRMQLIATLRNSLNLFG